MNETTVLVPLHWRDEFFKKMRSLNAKAYKFGVDEVQILDEQPVTYIRIAENLSDGLAISHRPKTLEDDLRYPPYPEVVFLKFKITSPVIWIGGYQVVAKLEALGSGSLSLCVTNDEDDARAAMSFAAKPIECEHCKAKRKRKDSFILRGADGYMQVGTTCLKDFTGHDPAQVLFLAKLHLFFNDYSWEDGVPGRWIGLDPCFSLTSFLAASAFSAHKYGWVSKAKAEEDGFAIPTAHRAHDLLTSPKSEDCKEFCETYHRWVDTAKKIIEFVGARPVVSPFDANLKVIFEAPGGALPLQRIGFAAAAVPTYFKHLAEIEAREKKADEPVSVHVGAVNDLYESAMTLTNIHRFTGYYGPASLLRFVDTSGNVFIWSTTMDTTCLDDKIGSACRLQAKIKGHTEFRGVKQTEITRARLNW